MISPELLARLFLAAWAIMAVISIGDTFLEIFGVW